MKNKKLIEISSVRKLNSIIQQSPEVQQGMKEDPKFRNKVHSVTRLTKADLRYMLDYYTDKDNEHGIFQTLKYGTELHPNDDWFLEEYAHALYAGVGCIEDVSTAFLLYQDIIVRNPDNENIQERLGECHLYGHGTAKDWLEAVKWFDKAEKRNNAEARFYLGHIYAKGGNGVTQDLNKAIYYFQRLKGTDKEGASDLAVYEINNGYYDFKKK